jgi:CRP-like cAMP-binding protein
MLTRRFAFSLVLFLQGESGYKMYIIVKGRARMLKPSPLHSPSPPPHPDESLPVDPASILQPGATFGELSVLRARPRDCSIFAGGHHHPHLYRQH